MAVHTLADVLAHFAETCGAVVVGGAITHWLGQKPTDEVQWRRSVDIGIARAPARLPHADETEQLPRRAI